MLRLSVGSVALLALLAGALLAADKNDKASPADHNQGEKAKVVNVNPREGTITLEMKDKDGKETKRTFHLTEDVRVFDEDTGRAAALDVFRSGDEVLFVEAQGKLRELHRHPKNTGDHQTNKDHNKK